MLIKVTPSRDNPTNIKILVNIDNIITFEPHPPGSMICTVLPGKIITVKESVDEIYDEIVSNGLPSSLLGSMGLFTTQESHEAEEVKKKEKTPEEAKAFSDKMKAAKEAKKSTVMTSGAVTGIE